MVTVDLSTTYREHYTARRDKVTVLEIPPRPFLMIDGRGDPNAGGVYAEAIAALYPLAYGLRKVLKEITGDAFKVMPLEGLWWVPDMATFSVDRKDEWQWTMMISQPDLVTDELTLPVLEEVTAAKKLAAGHLARLETLDEGLSAQILHVGPYADEAAAIDTLHGYIDEHGYRKSGKHHEIYLSDARRTDPSKLRTIIRQPIAVPRESRG